MLTVENVCLFMHSIENETKQKIENKKVYYRSINVIIPGLSLEKNLCAMIFNLLQFKIHINLKSDGEN